MKDEIGVLEVRYYDDWLKAEEVFAVMVLEEKE